MMPRVGRLLFFGIELDLAVRTGDHPPRSVGRVARLGAVLPAEDPGSPLFRVLKVYFVPLRIDASGAENGSTIPDVADRGGVQVLTLSLTVLGTDRCLLKC